MPVPFRASTFAEKSWASSFAWPRVSATRTVARECGPTARDCSFVWPVPSM